jgi:protein gp37
MNKTTIQWTNRSANPIRARHKGTGKVGWHCVMPSRGCLNCYSHLSNRRFGTGLPYNKRSEDEIEIFFDPRSMEAILRLREKGQKFFICDMTDMFADFVLDEWLDQLFAYMYLAGDQVFQTLTKRPERMLSYIQDPASLSAVIWAMDAILAGRQCPVDLLQEVWPPKNWWAGVSVEDQQWADERIPILVQVPAAVRFLSVEPLLEDIMFRTLDGIDWAIIGGESGSKNKVRQCDPDWIASIMEQCRLAGVPVFVKQFGSRPYKVRLVDKKGGDPAEWPDYFRVREFPNLEVSNI